MKVTVRITANFKSEVKPLLKKFPFLSKDLINLETELLQNPGTGTPPGNDAYKIRLKITSKGKGKSGGARVITFIETIILGVFNKLEEEIIVNLISIYDKSDTATISDKELKDLIKAYRTK